MYSTASSRWRGGHTDHERRIWVAAILVEIALDRDASRWPHARCGQLHPFRLLTTYILDRLEQAVQPPARKRVSRCATLETDGSPAICHLPGARSTAQIVDRLVAHLRRVPDSDTRRLFAAERAVLRPRREGAADLLSKTKRRTVTQPASAEGHELQLTVVSYSFSGAHPPARLDRMLRGRKTRCLSAAPTSVLPLSCRTAYRATTDSISGDTMYWCVSSSDSCIVYTGPNARFHAE